MCFFEYVNISIVTAYTWACLADASYIDGIKTSVIVEVERLLGNISFVVFFVFFIVLKLLRCFSKVLRCFSAHDRDKDCLFELP